MWHNAGSLSPFSTFQKDKPSVFPGHVRNNLSAFPFLDHRAIRYLDDHIRSVFAAAVFLIAILSIFCGILADMPEISQCIQPIVHFKNNVSAVTAVTAVRTAVRHIFFPAERNVPIAAFSASYIYFRSVCKHFITRFPAYIQRGFKHI